MATNPFSLSDYVRAASPAPSFAPAPASPVPLPLEEPEPVAQQPAAPPVPPAPAAETPALDVVQPQVARPRAGVYTPETIGELKAAFGDGPLPKGYELFEIEEPTTGERNYFLNYDEDLRKAQIAEETPGGITGTLKTVGSVPLRGAAKTAELLGSVSGAVTDLGTRAVESGAESLNIPFVPELARGVRETEKAVRETVLAPAVRLREWAESWGTTVDPERRDMGFFDSVATGLDERGEGGFEAYARSTIQTLGNVAAELVGPMKGLGAATGAAAKGLKLGKAGAAALGKYGSVIPFATEGIVEREKREGRNYSPVLSAAEGFMNAATMLPVYSSLLGKEAIRGVAPGAVAGLKAWSEGMLRDFGSNALAFTAMRAGTVPFKQGPEGFMERMKDALDPRANLEAATGAFSLSPFHAARVAKAVREGRTMDARDALLRATPAADVLRKMAEDPKFTDQVNAQTEELAKAKGITPEEARREVLATQIAVIRQEQDKLGNLSDAVMEDNAHAKTAAAAVADAAARGSSDPAAVAFREWLVENPPDVDALHRDVLAQRDRQTAAEPVAEPSVEPAVVRTAEPSAAETLRTDLPAELAAEQTRVNDLFRNARTLIESGADPAAVEAAQVEATRADIALQKRIGIFDQARAGAPGAPPLLPEDRPRDGRVVTGPSEKPALTNEQIAAQMEADIPRIRAEWAAKLAAMQARLSEGAPEAEAAARPVEPVTPEAAPDAVTPEIPVAPPAPVVETPAPAPPAKKRAAVRRKAAAKAARDAAESLPSPAVVEALPPADRTALVVDALEVTRTVSPGDAPLAKGQAEQIAATINALMAGSPAEAARAVEAARTATKPRRAPKPPVEAAEQAMLEPAEASSPKAAKAEAAEPLAVSVAVDPAPAGSIAAEPAARKPRAAAKRAAKPEGLTAAQIVMRVVSSIPPKDLTEAGVSRVQARALAKQAVEDFTVNSKKPGKGRTFKDLLYSVIHDALRAEGYKTAKERARDAKPERLEIAVRAENADAPPVDSAAAADLLARSVARYSKDINVLTYRSPAEDPAFRDMPEADRPRGAAYYEPAAETITFYTDRLRMDTAQKAAAVHEVAHMGIRKLVGEANASRFFEALYSKLPRDLMQEIERRYGGPAKNAIDRINQAQELVARYAERLVRNGTLRPTEMSWFRRLVVRPLKNLLRKAFNNPMFGGWDEYDIALFVARGLRKLRSYRADDTASGADSRLLDRDANVADIINIMAAKGESLGGAAITDSRESRARVTDSPEFKRWFGDSKVVKDGEPLVVYHGTVSDFPAFSLDKIKANFRQSIGFHFTSVPEIADGYSLGWGENVSGAATIPVYLSIKNPLRLFGSDAMLVRDKSLEQVRAALLDAKKSGNPYDGIISHESDGIHYVVFDPTQIKSVNNRGTWDPFKESILEMRRTPEEELDDLSAYYRDLKQARDGRGVSARSSGILRDTLARFGIRSENFRWSSEEGRLKPGETAQSGNLRWSNEEGRLKPVEPVDAPKGPGQKIMDMAVREGEKALKDFAPENLRPLPEPMSKPFIMGPDGKEIRNPDYKTTREPGGFNREQILRHFETEPSEIMSPADFAASEATKMLDVFARLRGEPDVVTNAESIKNAEALGKELLRDPKGAEKLLARVSPLVKGNLRDATVLLGLTAGRQIQKLQEALEAVRKNPDDPMLKAYLGSVRMDSALLLNADLGAQTEIARMLQLRRAIRNEMLSSMNPTDALKFKTWEKILKLQNAGSDLDLAKMRMLEEALTKHADDLPALMDALRKIEPATLMEKLVEGYAMNNLGFKSNGKNLVSNTLMAGYNLGLVYPAVDLVEAIRTGSTDPLKAGWARTKGWFRPVIRTVTDTQAFLGAVAKFADIMMERTHVQSGVSEPMGKIGGNLGRLIRWGGNLNSAADYMFKSLAFNAAVSEWAYVETSRMAAEAAKKGRAWTPEQFAAELASRTNNPSLAGVERGTLMQNYFTFQDALDRQGIVGAFGSAAQGVKRQIPIIGFLLPYIKTPTNLLAFFYRATPIGAVDTLRERTALGLKMTDMVMNAITGEMRNRLQEAKDTGVFSSEVERRISEEVIVHSMLGLAGFVAGTYLAATGRLTGMAKDADERRRMDESELGGEGRIRIGDTVFAYDALDPFSTIVSAGAGFYNSYVAKQEELRKRGAEFAAKGSKVPAAAQMDAQDIAGVLGSSIGTMLRSTVKQGIGETYLTSPRQFLDAIDDDSAGGTRVFKFLRNVMGSTFIPLAAPLRELSQANDPNLRDINSRLLTYGPGAAMADYLKANIPFAGRETLPPVYKTVGEAKPNYRRNPYWFGPANMDRIGNELSRLDAVPMDVTPMFRRLGLTPEELEFANQTRGQLVKTALGRLINSPGYSRATDDAKSKAVRRTIEQINNTVERRIVLARRRAGMESPR